jgi:hypothetical protein
MASGHANRAHRPNTWLHRPATRREILLANPEPSTHGTSLLSAMSARMSASVMLGGYAAPCFRGR